jgi:anti-sigma factor RsiW
VAHLTDGTLRRMFDDPDAKVGADASHLESCADCQARFKTIADDARSVATLLAMPEPRVDVARAFATVNAAHGARPAIGLRMPVLLPVRRPALALVAAVAAAAVVVVAFAASGFFFQPTKVQAVPVTLSDLQALSELGSYGTITWTKQPQFDVDTSAPSGAPVVAKLPKGVSTTVTYASMSEAVATFTFSASKASAAAAARGKTLPALPKNVDGATLTITVGPAVGEVYGDLNRPTEGTSSSTPQEINLPQLVVAKSVAPKISATQVSVTDLENVILEQPGISAELKKTIKAFGADAGNTLFIPVPVEYANSSSVTVQGVDGVALGDNTGLGSAVVWLKGGHVYAVAGSIKQSDAIDIANNLK